MSSTTATASAALSSSELAASLSPTIRQILPPPAIPPNVSVHTSPQNASQALLAKSDLTVLSKPTMGVPQSSPRAGHGGVGGASQNTIQRHISMHPCQPLVAFLLEDATTSSIQSKMLVVQHTITRQVVFSLSWMDLAAALYQERDARKLVRAANHLGSLVSLAFYDPSTVFWSRLTTSTNYFNYGNSNSPQAIANLQQAPIPRWQSLLVQTTHRIMMLNLRQGPTACAVLWTHPCAPVGSTASSSSPLVRKVGPAPLHSNLLGKNPNALSSGLIQAHVHEKLAGAVPSSNALALSDRSLLVGFGDGSLKCYDFRAGQFIKSIKGLGKGDWVVQMVAANRYARHEETSVPATDTGTSSSTATTPPVSSAASAASAASSHGSVGTSNVDAWKTMRMVTLTKKCVAYLIEVLVHTETQQVDIKPPLARFVGGPAEVSPSDVIMEHSLLTYDAHRDWILWWTPPTKQQQQTFAANMMSTPTASGASLGSSSTASGAGMNDGSRAAGSSAGGLLNVWDLHALQAELQQSKTSSSASTASNSTSGGLYKPEPTLKVQFTTSSTGGLTVTGVPCWSTWQEDTLMAAVVSSQGDLFLQGAVASPSGSGSSTTSVQATPVLGVSLGQVLQSVLEERNQQHVQHLQATGGSTQDTVNIPEDILLRVHAIQAQPLGAPYNLVVATNVGLLLVELPRPTVPCGFTRHWHLGAGLGSLGKSVLTVHASEVRYGSLDAMKANPAGRMEAKNVETVYESPKPIHLGAVQNKRPFRGAPVFLASPSGQFVCLFWPTEYRYEILHAATLLSRVGRKNINSSNSSSPAVASGVGIVDFAWVGDEGDVFAILHAPEVMEQAALLVPTIQEVEQGGLSVDFLLRTPNLSNLVKSTTSIATNATKATLGATVYGVQRAADTATAATTATLGATIDVATKAGSMAIKTTTKTANMVTSGANVVGKSFTRGGKKILGFAFGKKRKGQGDGQGEDGTNSIDMTVEDDDEEDGGGAVTVNAADVEAQLAATMAETAANVKDVAKARRFVELRVLVLVESQASELSGSIAAATSSSLGELPMRGGSNRNPPTSLFGGPVLCVGTRSAENEDGHAHFYTRKREESSTRADVYQSTGPTLPYPDLCVWDDDGVLCAIVLENRVAVYHSKEPNFVLLGTVYIGSPSHPKLSPVTCVKFVHGVLYCCTWNSVHCVMLGDVENEERVCHLESFLLASSHVPSIPELAEAKGKYVSFCPPTHCLPLVQPTVLGYQSGSLLVSSLRGVHAIPLSHPLMRIGLLLSAGQVDRAVKWFDAVPESDHEALAAFLERRGHPDLALQLHGLSLETQVDLCMRFQHLDRLEELVETYGARGIRTIDMGRGVAPSLLGPESTPNSMVVCVGAYLLAHGKVELARQLATESLRLGEEGKKDALFLGTLLLPVDESDACRLIHRAVEEGEGNSATGGATGEWLLGNFVREHILRQ